MRASGRHYWYDYAEDEHRPSELFLGLIDAGETSADGPIVIETVGLLAAEPPAAVSAEEPFDNTIVGTTSSEHLYGAAGRDLIQGLGGHDVLAGRDGADQLEGGDGNDFLFASHVWYTDSGPEQDVLLGGAGNDWIYAGLGDVVDGGSGVYDILVLYDPASTEAMHIDLVAAASGTVQEFGAGGTLVNVEGIFMTAGVGNDIIWAHTYFDRIFGGGGDDHLRGGDGNDTLGGGQGNDVLEGESGADRIYGDGRTTGAPAGDDAISGGSGDDYLYGGEGDDYIEGGEDDDRLFGELGADSLHGGGGFDRLDGGDDVEIDILSGGDGDDDLSSRLVDHVDGGAGRDFWTLDIEDTSTGVVIDLSLAVGVPQSFAGGGSFVDIEEITFFGGSGDDRVTGGQFGDALVGGYGDDLLRGMGAYDNLRGGEGNDVLEGGDGEDQLHGQEGNDVLNGGGGDDRILGGEGIDVADFAGAEGAVTVSLLIAGQQSTGGAGIDTLEDIENLSGSAFGDTLTGDDGVNRLDGRDGADLLIGGSGDDLLTGGAGHDTFRVGSGSGSDTITDFTVGGSEDRIQVLGYTSALLIQVGSDTRVVFDSTTSVLVLNALATRFTAADINVAFTIQDPDLIVNGTPEPDVLYGQTGDDTLNGLAGDDQLFGDNGNDILNGGAGADLMTGGVGNDWYYVDNAGDQIVEATGEGVDRVLSSINYTLAAGASVEFFTTTFTAGTGAIDLTGNELGQSIAGNNGDNVLDGGAGDDVLFGHQGDDTLIGGLGADTLDGGLGFDMVDYSSAAGAVTVNLLLQSGTGPQGADVLKDIESVVGSAYDDRITGNSTVNALAGGLGSDWYFVQNLGDIIIEASGEGALDRVFSSANYILNSGAAIEILSTTHQAGTAAINLTGNELGQSVVGNNGANLIDGAAGDDVLYGHQGDDILIGGLGNDWLDGGLGLDTASYANASGAVSASLLTLTATGAAGTDTFRDIEGLTGSAFNDSLTGNHLANTLFGGEGDDVLNGREGADTMIGGGGDDWYHIDNAGDLVLELAGGGTADRILSPFSYTLAAGLEVEILTTSLLAGTGSINLSGNAASQTIAGNNGVNILSGWGGDDVLYGHDGADMLLGGAGDDILWGGGGADTFHFEGSSFGNDFVRDWQDGVDVMRFVSIPGVHSFSHLTITADSSGHAVVTLPDGSTVTVIGVAPSTLDASDFSFG